MNTKETEKTIKYSQVYEAWRGFLNEYEDEAREDDVTAGGEQAEEEDFLDPEPEMTDPDEPVLDEETENILRDIAMYIFGISAAAFALWGTAKMLSLLKVSREAARLARAEAKKPTTKPGKATKPTKPGKATKPTKPGKATKPSPSKPKPFNRAAANNLAKKPSIMRRLGPKLAALTKKPGRTALIGGLLYGAYKAADFLIGPEEEETPSGSGPSSITYDVDLSGPTPHVDIALKERGIFSNGKLKETNPESWPHIARYWQHIGDRYNSRYYKAVAKNTLNGTAYADPKNKNHWSAAFIQYCMQNNEKFKELKWSAVGPGSHRHYWKQAKKNFKKLFKNELEEDDWIFLEIEEMRKFGISPEVGDLTFQRNRVGIHGDIKTPVGSVGGNLAHSVKVTSRPVVAMMTQRADAKNKILQVMREKINRVRGYYG